MTEHITENNGNRSKTAVKIFKIVILVLLLILYTYSLVRRGDYYSGNHGVMKLCIITGMYAVSFFAVLWRNKLSDRNNMLISAGMFCITPFICYLIVECANSEWSALFVEGAGLSIKLHFLNGMIFVFGLIFVFLLAGSFRTAAVTVYALSTFMGLLMYYVCIFRGTAFVATDIYSIQAAMTVGTEYDYNPNFGAYFAITLCVTGICICSRFNGKVKAGKKIRAVMIALAVVLCGVFNYTYFHMDYTENMKVKLFKPQETYTKKGCMLTVVRSFCYMFPEKPEGYSVSKTEEIAERYRDAMQQSNKSAEQMPNLILIMNESLSDMCEVSNGKLAANKEVLPVIKSLKENTYKGVLHEERRGGGTAIMEFETLTGCTNAFFPIGTIAYQTIIRDETPSIASQLDDNGYEGLVASHPYKSMNYNRDDAYPLLGFRQTKFITDFDMAGNNQLYGRYISDMAAFNEIIDEYEQNNGLNDSPFFAFQVTMQNHAPYDMAESREIRITSEEFLADDCEQYLNYAHESDKAFGKLIDYFKGADEPTLIVMFGDHAPRFAESYYRKLLGIDTELTDEQEMSFQQTPVIFWANYDIGSGDLGDLSNNYLAGIIMDVMGIKRTGYQMFLEDLRQDVPVINSLGYQGADGKFYDIDDKTSPYYDSILEYKMLEYNNLVDTDNRIEWFFESKVNN